MIHVCVFADSVQHLTYRKYKNFRRGLIAVGSLPTKIKPTKIKPTKICTHDSSYLFFHRNFVLQGNFCDAEKI